MKTFRKYCFSIAYCVAATVGSTVYADTKIADSAANFGGTTAARTPDGVLEVVGGKDNIDPSLAKPTFIVRNTADDTAVGVTGSVAASLIVTQTGRVGIGTNAPSNRLEISGLGGTGTGLTLRTGAGNGKVLTSDVNGNAFWQNSSAAGAYVYSEIHGAGGVTTVNAGNRVNCLSTTIADTVQATYGSTYGWDNTNKRWVAPFTGKYEVSTNAYFGNTGVNSVSNMFAYKNGTIVVNRASAAQPSGPSGLSTYTSAIVNLAQGEFIEWKAPASQGNIKLTCSDYSTYVRVKSL